VLNELHFDREDILARLLDDDDMLVFELRKEPVGGNMEPPLLVHAAQCGCSPQILASLLRRGADPNGSGSSGFTALHVLAVGPVYPSDIARTLDHKQTLVSVDQCLACARWIVEFGADPHCPDAMGRAAMDVAEANGRKRLADFLRFFREMASCSFLRAVWCRQEGVETQPGLLSMRDDTMQLLYSFLEPQ